jgi:predicted DsbA family dithiol-disulfide isomerase
MGIQCVPLFILLQKCGVSGAQPSEFCHDALPEIAGGARRASEAGR